LCYRSPWTSLGDDDDNDYNHSDGANDEEYNIDDSDYNDIVVDEM